MPALTLKNIQRTGEAGTEALKNAGSLFDRAFKSFTGAAQTVQAGKQAAFEDEGVKNTEALKQAILSAQTPEQIGALPGVIDQANPNFDVAAINELQRNQPQNAFDLNQQANIRETQPALTTINNQVGTADPSQLGALETQLQGLAGSGVDTTGVSTAIEDQKTRLAAGNQRDKDLAIEAATNNPELANFQAQPGGGINDTVNSIKGVQGLMQALPVSLQRDASRSALSKIGHTPDSIFAQFYNRLDAKGNPIGVSDPARLTKTLEDNLPGFFTAADIAKHTAAKNIADGTSSKKASVVKERDRQNKVKDALTIAGGKAKLKLDDPTYAVDLVNSLVESEAGWRPDSDDQAAAIADVGLAKASGKYTSDDIFSALFQLTTDRDYTSGTLLKNLEEVSTRNNEAALLKQLQDLQRRAGQTQ